MTASRAGDTDDETSAEDLQWWQDLPKYRQLLAEEIQLLRTNCAWPSRQDISDATADLDGHALGLQSISNVLNPRLEGDTPLSGWTTYRKVVEVLGGDLRYFYPLYLRACGLSGARGQFLRFERIVREGLPTLANPNAEPFVIPGHQPPLDYALEFVDEPPPLGEKLQLPHELWALQLKMNPGRWACVRAMSSPQYVTSVIKGGIRTYRPAGSFEAVWRLNHFYMRFIGEDGEYA